MTTSLISSLLDKKLVFVTGKGGIGKTLISASLGQAAAATGLNVLVAESAAHDQLAPVFGLPPVGHQEQIVSPNLKCINLSAAGNFREYVTKYLKQKVLFDTVFNHRVVKSFFNTIPGLAEVMLLGRLFYSLELSAKKADFLVFDGAASGHFHSLMTTPDAILSSGLAGPLVKETQRIRDYLSDPSKCGLIVVATPEDLVVAETLDFLPKLAKASPVKLSGIVLNRVPPPLNSKSSKSVAESKNAEGSGRTSADAGAEAEIYISTQYEKASRARDQLMAGLASLKANGSVSEDLSILETPDFGFVPEPLAADFYKMLMNRI